MPADTDAFWKIEEGDTIGFRGPYGNSYPTEAWEGKNLIFIGGGDPAKAHLKYGRIHLPVSPGCNIGCRFCASNPIRPPPI